MYPRQQMLWRKVFEKCNLTVDFGFVQFYFFEVSFRLGTYICIEDKIEIFYLQRCISGGSGNEASLY